MAKKILFIEDKPEQTMALQAHLKAAGYEVIAAHNADDGITKTRSARPDLVLLNIVNPPHDGLKACTTIKRDTGIKKIPIIMFTAYGVDHAEEQSFSAGADDCIRKPYEPKELLQKIQSLLGKENTTKEKR